MLRVPLTQARPGMTLAQPVLHPVQSSRVLLRQGYVLDQGIIDSLREQHIPSVWIRYPGLEFVGRFISPKLEQARGTIGEVVSGVVERMAHDATTPADYGTYKSTIRDFIETMSEHADAQLLLQNMGEAHHPLIRHSSDVCYLALLMGMRLGDYLVEQRERLPHHRARSIKELGLAALLHDIGLLALEPPGYYDSWIESGGDETDPVWREHVTIGYQRVREHLPSPASAAVLHHHQRYDGTGFPTIEKCSGAQEAMSGDEIHVYARILFAANLFDRLRFPPGAGVTVPCVRVLRTMLMRPMVDWIDPTVFRALLSVAPAYPPGSVVGLSTGERAAVIDWTGADPCRPVVQVIGDLETETIDESRRYDLRVRREITVTTIDGEDVSGDNFYPQNDGEYELYLTNSSAMRAIEGGASEAA